MTTSLHLWGVPELTGTPAQVLVPERRCQLLSWLAMRSGEWLPRDDAAMLLWPGHESAQARRKLRKVLVEARSLPGVQGLDVQEHALRWTVGTDLLAFEAALRADPPRAAEALALRRGPLMAGLDQPANPAWSDWLHAERARLDRRWQRLAHDHLQALAEPAARGEWAQRLLLLDPLDDVAMAGWIEACLAQGALGAARQAWTTYAERLAHELGIEPPSHLRAMLDRATVRPMHMGAGATATPAPASEARAPAGFVGRRAELAELGARLAQPGQRLLTLLGPGGVGKSRLARQLLVQAEPGAALLVEMHDLGDTAALAARLARQLGLAIDDRRDTALQIGAALGAAAPGRPRLLVLDNAEHLHDLPAWLGRLLAAAPSLQVLVTSRVRLLADGEQVLPLAGQRDDPQPRVVLRQPAQVQTS